MLVSIITVCYNSAKTVSTAIESVLNQTYENWELCLADGSDAEHNYVGEICAEYKARSQGRIIYQKLAN